MKIIEFVEIIDCLPADCELSTGNATACMTNEYLNDLEILNYYVGFSEEELKKDFSKIKKLIIWGDE